MAQPEPTLFCCGEADSVAVVRRAVAELRLEILLRILLRDLHLGGGDSSELTRELTETQPEARIIVLSLGDEEAFACSAPRAGARGYTVKSEATESVLSAIETVLRCPDYRDSLS